MFLVKTKLRPSSIHGNGVFADEFIPKGTVVWAFHPGIDREITEAEFAALPEAAQRELRTLAYLDNDLGVWVLAFGHGSFINHADKPCLIHEEAIHAPSVAGRDIHPGEELTEDYRTYDAAWAEKLRDAAALTDQAGR